MWQWGCTILSLSLWLETREGIWSSSCQKGWKPTSLSKQRLRPSIGQLVQRLNVVLRIQWLRVIPKPALKLLNCLLIWFLGESQSHLPTLFSRHLMANTLFLGRVRESQTKQPIFQLPGVLGKISLIVLFMNLLLALFWM